MVGLLWFLNVQMHTLVSMLQQTAKQSQDPEAIAMAALEQMRVMIPGLDELLEKVPGGAQARVRNLLKRGVG